VPDNKYATLGLEASYIAQGQANRAQEILRAQQQVQQMRLDTFPPGAAVRLSAVVDLLDDNDDSRTVFVAPAAGGVEVVVADIPVMVITPASPLGRALLGKRCGDVVEVVTTDVRDYEIIAIS
jgi:transcription elongation GreA/GreB family factor